mmetsp:Transcript_157729/g.278442  ORF Transcript_157729/g.278442 Transcript_157729/m.278442 type:complete len:387 (-) Transcript_157729:141-1301(-)
MQLARDDPIVQRKTSFNESRTCSLGSTETGGSLQESLNSLCFADISEWHFLDEMGVPQSREEEGEPCRITKMCSSGAISRASSGRLFADPSETLIFLDWDDTLFPSTELFDRWGLPQDRDMWDSIELTRQQQIQLDKWSTACYHYLCTACSIADRCTVVTNSVRPWVTDCIDRFAPSLKSLFDKEDGLQIVYAREAHKTATRGLSSSPPVRWGSPSVATREEHEEQLRAWKYAAMRKEAKAFYSRRKGQTWKNLISIGDMRYEHDAIQDVAFRRVGPSREHLRTKAFTMGSKPSISAMTFELTHGVLTLPLIVHHNGDIDLDFNTVTNRFEAFADALDMPEIIEQLPASFLEFGCCKVTEDIPDVFSDQETEEHIIFAELLRDGFE